MVEKYLYSSLIFILLMNLSPDNVSYRTSTAFAYGNYYISETQILKPSWQFQWNKHYSKLGI